MQARELINFLGIIGKLKRNTRHCWCSDGRQESVADHSWQLAVMALLVCDEFPGVDINKVVRMCLIHDFGEAITGDIPSFYKTQQDKEKENSAIAGLIEQLPPGTADEFTGLFAEIAEMQTAEAKLFKALDKMEAIVSHNESPLDTWLELEFTENLTYGAEEVAYSEYLRNLKRELYKDSVQKIKDGR